METKKVKIGIIGTGYTVGIARLHVKAYRQNNDAELTALYDIVPGRAKEWANKEGLQNILICDTLEELFNNVDAVSVCTPNNTHAELTIKAIKAGKHVICEKPLASSYSEGLEMVKCAAENPDITSMVGFNYRDIPAVRYMKSIIDKGEIGKVFTYRHELGGSRIADPTGVKLEWRMQKELSGIGALADFGCHMLDLADLLLAQNNGKIKEVNSMINTCITERTYIDGNSKGAVTNDDCAVFNAKTEDGTLLSFVSNRIGIPRQTIEICGEGGMLLFYDVPGKLEIWLKDKNGAYDKNGRQTVQIPDEFMNESGHLGLINEFISSIIKKTPPVRNLERGLYIQYILENLHKSAIEGKTLSLD